MADVETRVHIYRRLIVGCIRGPQVVSQLIPKIKELEGDVGSRLKRRLGTDDISAHATSPVDELIDILMQSASPGKWQAFIEALEQSDYPHLARILQARKSDAVYDIDNERKIIQLFAPNLEKRINPVDIVGDMCAKNIINNADRENILARYRTHGAIAANVILLDRMQCRTSPKYWYPAVLHILMDNYRALVAEVDPDFYSCPDQYQPQMAAVHAQGACEMDVDKADGWGSSPRKRAKSSTDEAYCHGSVGENVITDYEDPSMNDLSPPQRQDSSGSMKQDSGDTYYSTQMSGSMTQDSGATSYSSQTSIKKEVDRDNLWSQDTKSITEKQLNIQFDVKPKHEEKVGIKDSDEEDNVSSDSDFDAGEETEGACRQKLKLRSYQLELAEHALKGINTVIFAETGSGKTYVALHIVQKHLESPSLAPRKVVFMARTNVLIQQQAKRFQEYLPQFRTNAPMGDSEESRLLGQLIPAFDIVCLTPQILINNLERGYIPSLTEFSMLVFDECHHTQKGEPYNRLMLRYLEEKEAMKRKRSPTDALPQVIGLTASLGVGKAHSDCEARDHILRVLANLDIRQLSTVRRHKDELMKYVNTPRDEIVPLCRRDVDPCRAELLQAIKDTEDQLEDIALLEPDMIEMMSSCPAEKNSQVYEKWTIDTEKTAQIRVDDMVMSRNIASCAKHLNVYCAALEVNHLLRPEDVVKYLADRFKVVGQQMHKLNELEKELLANLKTVQKKLVKHSRTAENPNLRFVSNTIRTMLSDKDEESRAMVFVQSRATCKALAKFLDKDLQCIGTGAAPLYGQDNRGDDDGMTDVVQSATMEKFKKGDVKVLVATSVGTEGIDVPNCDNVISYNYTGNEITKIQMSGRSRKKGGMTMVFGNEAIVRRENINAYKAHMMYRAMGLVREMKKADLERIIGKFQKEAMIRAKIQKELEQLKINQTDDNEYILKCKHCTTFACKSSDIRQVLMFRFVIDTEFDSRIEIRPHRKPLLIEGFEKRSKMYCKKCPMDWGIICTYQEIPCRVLKIENFTLMNMETGQASQPCKKWKDIPFSVPEVKPEEISKLVPARE